MPVAAGLLRSRSDTELCQRRSRASSDQCRGPNYLGFHNPQGCDCSAHSSHYATVHHTPQAKVLCCNIARLFRLKCALCSQSCHSTHFRLQILCNKTGYINQIAIKDCLYIGDITGEVRSRCGSSVFTY